MDLEKLIRWNDKLLAFLNAAEKPIWDLTKATWIFLAALLLPFVVLALFLFIGLMFAVLNALA